MLSFDWIARDFKVALRSLGRTKGLAITVVLTLALGIGANAAIFSVVRGVLLRPLVNRDEDRLIYIRQSAHGIGIANTAMSVPEIQDLESGVKTVSEFGDFSQTGFTMIGLGEPREVRAGVVDGSYFDVMGLRPVLGRLIDKHDDGRSRSDWKKYPAGLGRLGSAPGDDYWSARAFGAVSGGHRNYRERGDKPASFVGDDGDRARAPDDRAFRALGSGTDFGIGASGIECSARRDGKSAPGNLFIIGGFSDQRGKAAGSSYFRRENRFVGAARGFRAGLYYRLLECGEFDFGADGAARGRTFGARGIGSQHRIAATDIAGG
jgi:hypothetical protein